MNGWKTTPRRPSLTFLCKLRTTQVKSMKCQTYIQNKYFCICFGFFFFLLFSNLWSEIHLKKHLTSLGFPQVHTAMMWSWNTFLVCVYKAQNKALRWKNTWQLMTYNDRESSGNGKNAGTFWKTVFFLYWLYHTTPSETLISDSPSSTKGRQCNRGDRVLFYISRKLSPFFSPLSGACLPCATFLNFSIWKMKIMILTFIKVFTVGGQNMQSKSLVVLL